MDKHTEGEWYKESGDDDTFGYDIYYIHANGGKMVCEGICNPHDADLIKAAPKLLHGLDEAVEISQALIAMYKEEMRHDEARKFQELVDTWVDTIKRAKGES